MSIDKVETKNQKTEFSSPLSQLGENFRQANAYLNVDNELMRDRLPLVELFKYWEEGIESMRFSQNPKKAVELYKSLAEEAAYAPAQFQLGYCYEHGHGITTDKDEAKKWYQRAADQGDRIAKEALKALIDGTGNTKKINAIVEAIKGYVEKRNIEGFNAVNAAVDALQALTGERSKEEVEALIEALQKFTGKGNEEEIQAVAKAMTTFAGKGDSKGTSAAAEEVVAVFRAAFAGKGDTKETKACQEVAERFVTAQNCLNNSDSAQCKKGIELYENLALEGYALVQFKLGECYEKGNRGVPQDIFEAMFWYEMAAEQGYVLAQFKMGDSCEKGCRGINKNRVKAINWYRLAAEQGHVSAQFKMGEFCEKEELMVEAIKWYRLAAEQGYAPAQFKMGEFYEKGLGVGKNVEEASRWYVMSAKQGFEPVEIKGDAEQDEKKTGEAKPAAKGDEKSPSEGSNSQHIFKADCYLFGKDDIVKDQKKAAGLYQTLAEKGVGAALFRLGYCCEQGWGVEKNPFKAVILYRRALEAKEVRLAQDLDTRQNVAEALWTLEGRLVASNSIFRRLQEAITKDVIFVGETHPNNSDYGKGKFTPTRRAVMTLVNSRKVQKFSVELGTLKYPLLTEDTGKVFYHNFKLFKQWVKDKGNSFPLNLLPTFATLAGTATDCWEDVLSVAFENGVDIYFHDRPIQGKAMEETLMDCFRLKKSKDKKFNIEKSGWYGKIGEWQEAQVSNNAPPPKVDERNRYSAIFLREHNLLGAGVLVLGGADHFKDFIVGKVRIAQSLQEYCGKTTANVFDLSDNRLIFGPIIDVAFSIADLEAAIKKASGSPSAPAGASAFFALGSRGAGVGEQNQDAEVKPQSKGP